MALPGTAAAAEPVTSVSVTADGRGYAVANGVGAVRAFGTVPARGNPTGFTGGIVGLSVTADGQGYAAISSTGQVYAYGTVRYRSNPIDIRGSVRGISVTADGQGYAAVTDQGQVHAFGVITYRGDFPDVDIQNSAQHLNANRSVDWRFTGSGFVNVDQLVSVVTRADASYWAMQWAWTDTSQSTGGYMGLQTNGSRFDGSSGDTAIFSLWNANASSGPGCGRFSGEGSGLSCRLAYPVYDDGNWYRLRVWRLQSDAGGQWWGAWIRFTTPDAGTCTSEAFGYRSAHAPSAP